MSIYDEFNQMAFEMLNDPEVAFDAQLKIRTIVEGAEPWEPGFQDQIHNVKCFYYKPKNGMINGTVIQQGQKGLLIQAPVPEAQLITAEFIDHNGKNWAIKTVEEIGLQNKPILQKIIIGA
jgi:hypothetical protein